MMTTKGIELPNQAVQKYFKALVGQFYKILPIKESGEPSLGKYMDSLQREMIGCHSLIEALNYDELYISLLGVLQYLIENDCDVDTVRSEVFKAISICKKLQRKYGAEEV